MKLTNEAGQRVFAVGLVYTIEEIAGEIWERTFEQDVLISEEESAVVVEHIKVKLNDPANLEHVLEWVRDQTRIDDDRLGGTSDDFYYQSQQAADFALIEAVGFVRQDWFERETEEETLAMLDKQYDGVSL